jgi:hypothetical protein
MDGTLVPSPSSPTSPSFFENEMNYRVPSLQPFEKRVHVATIDLKQEQHKSDLSIITAFCDDNSDFLNKNDTANNEK